MRHLQLARWLMPALLFSALPLFCSAEVFNGAGIARHMMAASGEPQTQTDTTGAAQPQAPAKTPANRKHLNVSVGPVRMHIPVSGKRPVAANGPANGNTATGTPDLVHPVQQPLGTPSQRQEPLANGNAPDSGSGPADVRVETTGTSAQKARSTQEVQTPAGGGGKSGSENLPILMQPANGSEERAYQPPQPIAPATETLIREVDAHSPITFRWTPVIPKPQDPVTYRLSVWQLMVGQTGAQAMKANTPIITRDVDDMTQAEISNLVTGPCLPPYLCDFVWTVQALDRKDRPIGVNGGIVSMAAFRFEPGQAAAGGGTGKPQPNDNPITAINITLPSNPDANTANWGTGTSQFAIETVGPPTDARGMGRLYGGVNNSRILVIVKQNGNLVCGGQTPFGVVQGGFAPVSKVWSGGNAASLLGKSCTLPPGDYELDTQVVGAQGGTDVALSELVTRPFTIKGNDQQAYQPPQAIAPANETSFRDADAKGPITFRWTPVIPKPEVSVTYRLSVWQLMVGQTGAQAMKANTPIITKDVDNLTQAVISNLVTGPCLPPYLCDFVWTVQALDRKGRLVKGYNDRQMVGAFRVDAQSGGLLVQQPGGGSGGGQPRFAAGTYTSCCGLAISEVDSGGIYDRWGSPALAQKPTPGGSGTGTPAQIDLGVASGGVHRQVTPGAAMKANTPIITKDVDEQPTASGAGTATRSLAAPGAGLVKPQPADNPITAISITLPANPDAAKKVNGSANGGTGAHPANQFIITPYKGLDEENKAENKTTGGAGAVPAAGDAVVVGYGTQQKSAPNDGIPVINPDDVDSIDQTKSTNSGRERPAVANGVIIVTTKKGVKGQPAAVDPEAGKLIQNPGYVRAGENPATGTNGNAQTRDDAIKTNTPILEGSDLHLRKSSGTPPIEGMKANTPIITKDVDEQPAASGSGAATRSLAAPGSGQVKPQPADHPITAINITLPANPDANVKVNGTTGGGAGKAQGYMAGVENAHIPADKQAPNQNGKATRQTGSQLNTNTRSVAAPGSGPVKPQPADHPITAINITLPANPDANVKVNGATVSSGTASSMNRNTAVEIHEKQSPEDSASTQPPQPGGSSSGTQIKETGFSYPAGVSELKPVPGTGQAETPNQNGKAGSQPQTSGTPVVSSPESRTVTTDMLQGPQGAGVQASPTPLATAAPPANSTPQAKPAKKKSKMSIHVVF